MGTNCTRCNGLYVWDWDEAVGASTVRCLNCAHRPLDPPLRAPVPHMLAKPKVGDLVTCKCGQPKGEWMRFCQNCSRKKLNAEQRRNAAVKQAIKAKKITNGVCQ